MPPNKPPNILQTEEMEEKRKQLIGLKNFESVLKYWPNKKSHFTHMFGIIQPFDSCDLCREIDDPLVFFADGGTIDKFVETGEILIDGKINGLMAMIYWRWAFKGRTDDQRAIRQYGEEHLFRKEIDNINKNESNPFVELKISIPKWRKEVIRQYVEEAHLKIGVHMTRIREDFIAKNAKDAHKLIKLDYNVINRLRCGYCKQPATVFPIRCPSKITHRYYHYNCLVEACEKTELKYLMTADSLRCRTDRCLEERSIIISDESLPTEEDVIRLLRGTYICGLCQTPTFYEDKSHSCFVTKTEAKQLESPPKKGDSEKSPPASPTPEDLKSEYSMSSIRSNDPNSSGEDDTEEKELVITEDVINKPEIKDQNENNGQNIPNVESNVEKPKELTTNIAEVSNDSQNTEDEEGEYVLPDTLEQKQDLNPIQPSPEKFNKPKSPIASVCPRRSEEKIGTSPLTQTSVPVEPLSHTRRSLNPEFVTNTSDPNLGGPQIDDPIIQNKVSKVDLETEYDYDNRKKTLQKLLKLRVERINHITGERTEFIEVPINDMLAINYDFDYFETAITRYRKELAERENESKRLANIPPLISVDPNSGAMKQIEEIKKENLEKVENIKVYYKKQIDKLTEVCDSLNKTLNATLGNKMQAYNVLTQNKNETETKFVKLADSIDSLKPTQEYLSMLRGTVKTCDKNNYQLLNNIISYADFEGDPNKGAQSLPKTGAPLKSNDGSDSKTDSKIRDKVLDLIQTDKPVPPIIPSVVTPALKINPFPGYTVPKIKTPAQKAGKDEFVPTKDTPEEPPEKRRYTRGRKQDQDYTPQNSTSKRQRR